MTEPTKRAQVLVRVASVLIAPLLAGLMLLVLHQLWPSMEVIPGILIFVLLCIGFYHAGFWLFVDRPAELRKKFPVGAEEVRAQRKAFYDWLSSQRRR